MPCTIAEVRGRKFSSVAKERLPFEVDWATDLAGGLISNCGRNVHCRSRERKESSTSPNAPSVPLFCWSKMYSISSPKRSRKLGGCKRTAQRYRCLSIRCSYDLGFAVEGGLREQLASAALSQL